MIPSFEIKNYRLFKHLVIEKLARVNLITGKNNVGKTALLEALRLYTSEGSRAVIKDILNTRNELTDSVYNSLINFFYYNLHDSHKQIIIGVDDSLEQSLSLSINENDEPVEVERNNYIFYQAPVNLIFKGKNIKIDLLKDSPFMRIPSYDQLYHENFISSKQSENSDKNIFYWWDNITLTPLEKEVLKGLKLLEPNIENISLVEHPIFSGKRIFKAKFKDLKNPVSLDSMGEGMIKLLGINLALVNARNDTLLIDEIENGIHYTIQPKLWKMILEMAEKLDVQVFATTHSWDAVEGFQKALSEFRDPDQGQLIRLKEKNGDIKATIINAHDLAIATRGNIEVR